jgi:glutaredoxin/glutathione-dependent peroxiredoxin
MTNMTVKPGDSIPAVKLCRFGANGLEQINIAAYIREKRVIIIGVPGAFTPACTQQHMPGYVENAGRMKNSGADEIICIAMNDPFVMKKWGEFLGVDGHITMLTDGNGDFIRTMGLELDLRSRSLGIRSQRYNMIVNKGVVESVAVEPVPNEVTVSSAGSCMVNLLSQLAGMG